MFWGGGWTLAWTGDADWLEWDLSLTASHRLTLESGGKQP